MPVPLRGRSPRAVAGFLGIDTAVG